MSGRISQTPSAVEGYGRPQNLNYQTAQQLGIGSGMPSLLDALVGQDIPLQARRWMRRLLMRPPPPGIAAAIQEACRLIMGEPAGPMLP